MRDQTREASAKAEVKRAEDALAIKRAEDIQAKEKVAVAESAKRVTVAQLDDTANGLASIDSKARNTDPNDADAIRWLVSEREQTQIRHLALEGRKQREQAELQKAEADASDTGAAFRAAEDALKKARDHLTECEYDAQEARYVANGDPLPEHLAARRVFRERMEEEERQRDIRSCRSEAERRYFANLGERRPSIEEKMSIEDQFFVQVWAERHGEKPPSAEPSPALTADGSARKPLAANEQGWGHHANARSFDSAPAQVVSVRGGTGKGEWDPFSKEND